MANTIRMTCIACPAAGLLYIMLPGQGMENVVIAPRDFGRIGIEHVAYAALEAAKKGVRLSSFGRVNLNDSYNKRQLKHPSTRKFFVDVAIK